MSEEPKRRGRPPKARVEGGEVERLPDPVPGNDGEALARIAAYFRAKHPDIWETLRLCPLQHGIEAMVENLK